jgi:hypothetical protein
MPSVLVRVRPRLRSTIKVTAKSTNSRRMYVPPMQVRTPSNILSLTVPHSSCRHVRPNHPPTRPQRYYRHVAHDMSDPRSRYRCGLRGTGRSGGVEEGRGWRKRMQGDEGVRYHPLGVLLSLRATKVVQTRMRPCMKNMT